MRKLTDSREAIKNLSGLNEVSLVLSKFKPDSAVKGEPFYALMEHDNGTMTGKYFTFPARGDDDAILFFESHEKALYFTETREAGSAIKNHFCIRGISQDHLETLAEFMKLAFLYGGFIGSDIPADSSAPDLPFINVRFITPGQLLILADYKDSLLFPVLKKFFWHFGGFFA